ncbi:MAG: zinc-dependent peptidase [Planctomycetes bacterium]|nr:zinc-dependent peptidase [Planctomycetota bacterium]
MGWLKNRRRRKLLAAPLPAAWRGYLEANVRHYGRLPTAQQAKLRDLVKVFVAETNWEGCGGLEMTDEVRVTVAGMALLLAVGVEPSYYFGGVKSVLVYPDTYLQPPQWQDNLVVDEDGIPVHGEAWHGGPIVLTWKETLRGARDEADGRNLVLHEFAHHLDGLDGAVDGIPPLAGRAAHDNWQRVARAEFEQLVFSQQHNQVTLLDQYGATNEAEFFAVATECFFEEPREMQHHHAELYRALSGFYRQDPAVWAR